VNPARLAPPGAPARTGIGATALITLLPSPSTPVDDTCCDAPPPQTPPPPLSTPTILLVGLGDDADTVKSGEAAEGTGEETIDDEEGEGESELVRQLARWFKSLALSSASSSSVAPR
jgi:hypothetical protein